MSAPGSEPNATERAEARAIRKRWVTLAEIVAVAGLLISATTAWLSWSDRRSEEHEKQIEKITEARTRTLVRLTATPEHGGASLALKDAEHDVQSVDIRFPKALGVPAQNSILSPHVDADWIAKPLLEATRDGPDKREGRLPILVAASYWDGDQKRTDTAIYDLVWETEGGLIWGHKLKLKGLMLRERTASAPRLDGLWKVEKPR
ncbi:hypothetical protein AWL63_17920 [Sphingomonas panacis]|uniref:Uncharacterized protein n=1 Tax=Sphingomonas panacis TaxID=1560345 RepID=A0A1B3ZDN5_9SPHN|nr:hypothetical protein [Sphingomonas panacis]AOH85534.1 hypothetical protein AWL63_17920 [Sphingomonas panacis]